MVATPLLQAEVRYIDNSRGHGVFATHAMPAGTVIFKEHSLVGLQHKTNRAAGPAVCERCFRFVGPLETQMRALLRGMGAAECCVPPQLPPLAGMRMLPAPVKCACGSHFCSEACRDATFAEYHKLLCPACGVGDAMQIEGTSATGAKPSTSWARFEDHALATNEIFLMAAKAAALIVVRMQAGQSFQQAGTEFVGPPWWDAVARPEDVAPDAEGEFRKAMRDVLTQSWLLLCPILAPHAPPDLPLFATVDAYATIVGSFERRNCDVQVASPVEEYFLLVDDLPEGPEKAALEAVTQPILDTLDKAYDTPCEGIGLFPLQATLNHSCAPNVWLQKEAEDEEDGRVVAVLKEDVVAGEELCNSYIDIELPYAERQRELADYGFACTCARCVSEQPTPKRAGRKLK